MTNNQLILLPGFPIIHITRKYIQTLTLLRMKYIQTPISRLFVLGLVLLLLPMQVFAATFADVAESHFSYEAIELLSNLKVIKGYPNPAGESYKPQFRPDNPVNRVEALKMIMEGAKLAIPEVDGADNGGFSDTIAGAWYVRYIKKGKELGIVKGNLDGSFAAERQVNKVELIKMLLLANKTTLEGANEFDLPYIDIEQGAWYVPYVKYSLKNNIIYPSSSGSIEPAKSLSRSEVAEIVYRLVLIQRGGKVQAYLSQAEAALVQTLRYISLKEYEQARLYADRAKLYADSALTDKPDQPIVQAAHKVSLSVGKIVDAFIAGQNQHKEGALNAATEAKKLCEEAKALDDRVVPLTTQIIELAGKIIEVSK